MSIFPITIIIPHKDRHKNLDACLGALEAQTIRVERVVVSDWSEDQDRTFQVVKGRPQKIFGSLVLVKAGKPEHYQLTHARNAGRRYVRTPLMAVLDADCLLPPLMTMCVQHIFRVAPYEKKIVGSPVEHRTKSGELTKVPWSGKIISGGWQVFRTCDFDTVGGYNPFITGWGFEDQDFVQRLIKIGAGAVLLEKLPYEHLYHEPGQTEAERHEQETRNMRVADQTYFDGKVWKIKH